MDRREDEQYRKSFVARQPSKFSVVEENPEDSDDFVEEIEDFVSREEVV